MQADDAVRNGVRVYSPPPGRATIAAWRNTPVPLCTHTPTTPRRLDEAVGVVRRVARLLEIRRAVPRVIGFPGRGGPVAGSVGLDRRRGLVAGGVPVGIVRSATVAVVEGRYHGRTSRRS